MRRTAALLTVPTLLGVETWHQAVAHPLGALLWRGKAGGDVLPPASLFVLAGILTAASLLPGAPRRTSILQLGAGAAMLLLWLWSALLSGADALTWATGLPLLGTLLYSATEAVYALRGRPDPDPRRRGTIFALAALSASSLTPLAWLALNGALHLFSQFASGSALSAGTAAAHGLLAWAVATRQRWARPVGLLVVGGLFAAGAWTLARNLWATSAGATFLWPGMIFDPLPQLVLEAVALAGLARRPRDYSAAGSQPPPSAL